MQPLTNDNETFIKKPQLTTYAYYYCLLVVPTTYLTCVKQNATTIKLRHLTYYLLELLAFTTYAYYYNKPLAGSG